MGQHLIIRRDDVVPTTATTVMDDDDYDADWYPQRHYSSEYQAQAQPQLQPSPGKWRNFRFRFGALEFTYTSARVDQPRPSRDLLVDHRGSDGRGSEARGQERIVRAARHHDRRSFYDRFIDHLGVTAAVLIFLGGASFIATMQSRALVGSGSALGRIETRDVDRGQQASFPIVTSDIIAPTEPKAYAVQGAVISAQTPPSIDEAYASAPLPAPRVKAEPETPVRGFRAAIPQARDVAPVASAPAKASVSLGSGSWEKNPTISAAIDRAFASGDLQNWQVGSTEGVIVVGDAIEMNGKQCRSGSILARKVGEEARTQAFERCRAL